jgi:hypothetical protein
VVGTVAYMSPEQAVSFHRRATPRDVGEPLVTDSLRPVPRKSAKMHQAGDTGSSRRVRPAHPGPVPVRNARSSAQNTRHGIHARPPRSYRNTR